MRVMINNHSFRYLNIKNFIILIILLSVLLSGCTDNKKYFGTWKCQENNDTLILFKDGTFLFDSTKGNSFTNTYKVIDEKIYMNCIFFI